MLPRMHTIHRPETIDAALKLLAEPGAHIMALYGGPELFDDLEAAAEMEAVVSLAGLGLNTVAAKPAHDWRIGAMVTLAAFPESQDFQSVYYATPEQLRLHTQSALFDAIARSYPLNLRNMWTFGAVVAHSGASSPLLVTLLVLGARVELARAGEVDLAEYLPRRKPTDLITAVVVPYSGDCGAVVFEAVARTPSDEPIVCAAACAKVDDGRVVAAMLALGGVAKVPMPANDVALALLGKPATRASVEAALRALDAPPLQPPADFRGSSEYRREMAKVTARRALLRTLGVEP